MPGIIVYKNASNERITLEPVWGTAGVFPHLVNAGLPFFNGQIPLNSACEFMAPIYTGIKQCGGKAIIVFYPPPWTSYLETAMMLFLIASGSPHVYVVQPLLMVTMAMSTDSGLSCSNIAGTRVGHHTARDRRVEVATIATKIMKSYSDTIPDGVARVYNTIHASVNEETEWSLLDDLQRATLRKDQSGTIAHGIAGSMFNESTATTQSRQRERWREQLLIPAVTDIGVCLNFVYMLGEATGNRELASIQYELSKVQALIISYNIAYRANRDNEHLKDMFAVIQFLNVLLPSELRTDIRV